MNDLSYAKGQARLLVCLKDRELQPEEREVRGTTYREHLGHLTDDAWEYAVEQCISSLEWFPTVAELLAFSATAPRPVELALSAADDGDAQWRRSEGAARRRVKGHENDPDPDWSLPELSRDMAAISTAFFDWLYEIGGAKDQAELDDLFARWCAGRWQSPLSGAARGMLLSACRARQRNQRALDAPFLSRTEQVHYEATVRTNPRRQGEASLAYVERLAVNAGGMTPERAVLHDKKTEWFDPIAVVRALPAGDVPARPDPPEARLPYRDSE